MAKKTCEMCGSPLTLRDSFVYNKKNVCRACLRRSESGESAAVANRNKPVRRVPGLSTELCWFCQRNVPSPKASIVVKMHKTLEVGQSVIYPVFGVRQARYQKKTVTVPRCDSCEYRHRKQSADMVSTGGLAFIIGFIAIGTGIISGIMINKMIPGKSSLPGIFLGILCGFAAGFLSALVLGNLVPKEDKSTKKIEWLNHYPLIEQREAEGWKMGDKPML